MMKRRLGRITAMLLAVTLLLGAAPAYALGNVGYFGERGEELVDTVYDAAINFANVRNDKVFAWPSEGTVLLYTGTTYTPTLKKSIQKLDGMVIPAGLVVDIYHDCSVTNNPTYPHGYQFIAQYDTTDGSPETVVAQELMYDFDQAFGTSMADSTTSHGVGFRDFYDVRATDYFADAVAWALDEGVTKGSGMNAFSPDSTVTRAEAVTFLWRAAGSPAPSSAASPFTDVADPAQYYYQAVLWAVGQGVTNGVSAHAFNPAGTLAYDQLLAMLYRASGGQTGGDWSAEAMHWASRNGLTDGVAATAKADCPRRDVVYFLWKQAVGGQESGDADRGMSLTEREMLSALLYNSLLEQTPVVDVTDYDISEDELLALVGEIADINGNNPFYVNSFRCSKAQDGRVLTLNISYSLIISGSEEEVSEWIQNNLDTLEKAEEIVAQYISPGMSDYDIAKTLHDYLVLHCQYDMRLYSGNMPGDSYTASGALLEQTAVCAGYAKAYEVLMKAADIPCEYVTGMTSRGLHAWNIVQIGGAWYHVDTTWDDPIPDRPGRVRYDYFLLSDNAIRKDHTSWKASYACTSTKYDHQNLPDYIEGSTSGDQHTGTGTDLQLPDGLDRLIPSGSSQEYREEIAPVYQMLTAEAQAMSGQSRAIDTSSFTYSYVLEACRKLNEDTEYGSRYMFCRFNEGTIYVYDRAYAEETIEANLRQVEQAVAQREKKFSTAERCTQAQLTLWFQTSDLLLQAGYRLGSFTAGEDFTVGQPVYSGEADSYLYSFPLTYAD